MVLCSGCPRSYHAQCLNKTFRIKANSKLQFHCPQHECADCEQKTSDAGGLIYRCRWCERGYCEDCLDFDKADLLGDNLKEYEILGFPAVVQAFYIKCPSCKDLHAENPTEREFCDEMAQVYDAEFEDLMAGGDEAVAASPKVTVSPFSSAASLTDGTTRDSSSVTTPRLDHDGYEMIGSGKIESSRKRKADTSSDVLFTKSAKRAMRFTL